MATEPPQSESPPSRTNLLGSFLRGRPRNSSQSHIHVNIDHRELSPSPPVNPPSPNPVTGRRRGPIVSGLMHQPPPNNPGSGSGGLGFSNMLRRRRSAGNIAVSASLPPLPMPVANATTAPPAPAPVTNGATGAASGSTANRLNNNAPSHRIRLVPHLDNRRNLRFDAIARDLKEGDPALRIGRFTDRSGLGLAAVNALNSNKLAFKSKVVSRAHAEIWVEGGGKFYIKDTKSSSGTFLNHVRLSPANGESKPFHLKDGDILQLGVDYQGGAEDIYKSVKIRIELGREWQSTANAYNTAAIKNLKALAAPIAQAAKGGPASKSNAAKTQLGDCCICLFPVTIRQALFITPCSHTFHYKCLRPLLESHHPGFSCPLCRTFADLEEDVEIDAPDFDMDLDSPSPSEVGVVPGDESELEAAGGELLVPARENGAETEVEGEIRRTAGTPAMAEDPLEEEEENDMVIIESADAGGSSGIAIVEPGVDEMGGVTALDDVDGTVGGKRKR
ncbi:hypothetical protein D9611_010231 [Ephemerocybe angulata]|uniref:SMAD/FHA domain-containing protein n=1 Tax=Ephemerocybe angulata TaxID=980116 RepID=A0A8H5EVE1_9AGAR|nr:hypothetical protein D9611_010231 [Tulosesus angulatus]